MADLTGVIGSTPCFWYVLQAQATSPSVRLLLQQVLGQPCLVLMPTLRQTLVQTQVTVLNESANPAISRPNTAQSKLNDVCNSHLEN